ncbi:SDR family NAD(P)-dependent oxidoreductase [Cohnella cholangitidis]|uniref:SDR family oxidoreductase n=1 Tax=Cohnella cholangitidis TaxID=2598458 RepID=A0A7G5C6D8_9BACL|nr:SDR family oxidoreductase [Cohnella cholangitidis]QMV44772.1 SDR family oxidoreductase [Cohnella cholangitidis]
MHNDIRKTAIVTGASSGIGKGIAIVLAREGYVLSTVYRSNDEGIRDLRGIVTGSYGSRLHAVKGDLSDPCFVERYAREAIDALGKVDLLVNNAGVGYAAKLTEMKAEDILSFINVDFVAPILMMKIVGGHMLETGIKGNLINITSTRASRAYPHDSLYGGMKAALQRSSESIAIELAMNGIRVNNVAPGATELERVDNEYYEKLGQKIPLRRVGKPEDIGEAVYWLASDAASYITGVSLKVDGGLILPGMPEKEDETTKYYDWRPVK